MTDKNIKLNLTLKIKNGSKIDNKTLDDLLRQLFKDMQVIKEVQLMRGVRNTSLPKGVRGADVPTLLSGITIVLLSQGILAFIKFLRDKLKHWKESIGEDIVIELIDKQKQVSSIHFDLPDDKINEISTKSKKSVETEIIPDNKYALLIGNSNYKDDKFPKLSKPKIDVENLAAVLSDKNIAGFDTQILLDEPISVVQAEIAAFFNNKLRNDLLLLYYAGHGVRDHSGRYHLAMVDTKSDNLHGTAISAAFIKDRLDDSDSRRKVIILDSCHSGAFAEGARGSLAGSIGIEDAFKGNGYGRIVLTSTDAIQFALENGSKYDDVDGAVFTHSMINGLKTGSADLNGDGKIDLDELYYYVYNAVKEKVSNQEPQKFVYNSMGKLVIANNIRGPYSIPPEPVYVPNIDRLNFFKLNRTKILILSNIALIFILFVLLLPTLSDLLYRKMDEPIQPVQSDTSSIPSKYKIGIVKRVIIRKGETFKYTVRHGNSLKEIANIFNVSISQIKKLNNLMTNRVSVGQVLDIESQKEMKYYRYRVQLGDTNYSLSKTFNTSVSTLQFVNGRKGSNIIIDGELLNIFSDIK